MVILREFSFCDFVYEVRARASKGLGANEELDLSSFKALELGEHKTKSSRLHAEGL